MRGAFSPRRACFGGAMPSTASSALASVPKGKGHPSSCFPQCQSWLIQETGVTFRDPGPASSVNDASPSCAQRWGTAFCVVLATLQAPSLGRTGPRGLPDQRCLCNERWLVQPEALSLGNRSAGSRRWQGRLPHRTHGQTVDRRGPKGPALGPLHPCLYHGVPDRCCGCILAQAGRPACQSHWRWKVHRSDRVLHRPSSTIRAA